MPTTTEPELHFQEKDIENPDVAGAVEDLKHALKLDEKFIDALYAMAAAQKSFKTILPQ